MSEDSIHWRAPTNPTGAGPFPDPGGFPEDGAFFLPVRCHLSSICGRWTNSPKRPWEGLQDLVANRAGGLFALRSRAANPLIRASSRQSKQPPFRSREDVLFQLEADRSSTPSPRACFSSRPSRRDPPTNRAGRAS